jgi:hypothetical protein
MHKKKKLFISIIAIFNLISFAFAQEESSDWKIFGQVQLRGEVDARDFSNKTNPFSFSSLRTRLGAKKTLMNQLDFFVEFQDSRVLGQERNTAANISNVDLYQGYIKLRKIFDLPIDIQIGRFGMFYGTERFFGMSNWSYTGRAFDGIRFTVDPEDFAFDLFVITHTQTLSYIGNATPATYPISATRDHFIYGFRKNFNLDETNSIDFIGYYDFDKEFSKTIDDTVYLNRFTAASTYIGKFHDLSLTAEAAFQLGKKNGKDLSAFMVSAYAAYNFNPLSLGLGADIFSGTKPTELKKDKSFETNYGTGHKYFGYMDYFVNIPSNTKGLGINDFYLTSNLKFVESKFSAQLDAHHFMANQKSLAGESSFGQEVDLTIRYDFIKGTVISWGGSVFLPGDLMKTFWKTSSMERKDLAFWTYLMVTANIN